MAISNILKESFAPCSTLSPFVNIHYFATLQMQHNPRSEDGVFQLQGLKASFFHSSDHSQGRLLFSYQLFNAGKWLGWYFPSDRHPVINRVNADSAFFGEPVAALFCFLEPFPNVTFRVHFSTVSYRKRERKRGGTTKNNRFR